MIKTFEEKILESRLEAFFKRIKVQDLNLYFIKWYSVLPNRLSNLATKVRYHRSKLIIPSIDGLILENLLWPIDILKTWLCTAEIANGFNWEIP